MGLHHARCRPSWPSGSPALAPGDLNRVFFTTGGGEAVESAWKAAKQYFKLIGKPLKHKVISRAVAYHGTPHGALAITGLPNMKKDFEPVAPGGFRVPNTNLYRHPEFADDPKAFGRWAADRIEEAILFEGPDTVAAVFLEPVQNSGGCFTPPPGYFERVREICDRHDVLLVSDEVICAFGRHGATFACEKFGYTPDLITCAKGMSSGYGAIGAMIASEKVIEPFLRPGVAFPHGYTFGGHPVAAALSLANLDIMENERLNQRVLDNEAALGATLRQAAGPADRRRRPRRRLLLGRSSWSRTRPPGRPSTPPSGSGSSAASCPARCSTTACTAVPTTAATWSSRSRRR